MFSKSTSINMSHKAMNKSTWICTIIAIEIMKNLSFTLVYFKGIR